MKVALCRYYSSLLSLSNFYLLILIQDIVLSIFILYFAKFRILLSSTNLDSPRKNFYWVGGLISFQGISFQYANIWNTATGTSTLTAEAAIIIAAIFEYTSIFVSLHYLLEWGDHAIDFYIYAAANDTGVKVELICLERCHFLVIIRLYRYHHLSCWLIAIFCTTLRVLSPFSLFFSQKKVIHFRFHT